MADGAASHCAAVRLMLHVIAHDAVTGGISILRRP